MLPAEVLDKVEFEKIAGGEVTAVARQLLKLSEDQCRKIRELIAWREAELVALRHRQEQQAVLTKNDPELQERHAGERPMLTWEIPIGDRKGVREEFYDRATGIVGENLADRLFGKRRTPLEIATRNAYEPRAGVGHHHQVSAVRGDGEWVMRTEYAEMKWKRYFTQQSRISITELSEEFRAVIERELALLGK